MTTFFHPVQTISTTGKSEKGKRLQEMAQQFDCMAVEGENATTAIVVAMRDLAARLDEEHPRGSRTYIELTEDPNGNGVITAWPVSEQCSIHERAYFRIYFNRIAREMSVDQAKVIAKGGEI